MTATPPDDQTAPAPAGVRYAVRIEADLLAHSDGPYSDAPLTGQVTGRSYGPARLRLPESVTWPDHPRDTDTARSAAASGNGNLFVLCWWFDTAAPPYLEGCLVDPVLEISYVPDPAEPMDLRANAGMPVMPARATVSITSYDLRGHGANRDHWPASVNDIRTWADMPTRPHDGFGGPGSPSPAAQLQWASSYLHRYAVPPGACPCGDPQCGFGDPTLWAASAGPGQASVPSLAAVYSARWAGLPDSAVLDPRTDPVTVTDDGNGGMVLMVGGRRGGRASWLAALHASCEDTINAIRCGALLPARPAAPAAPARPGKRKRRRRAAGDELKRRLR